MLALGFSILLLAFACWLAFGSRPANVATVLFCAAWGMMLFLYRVLGSDYEYLRWVIFYTIACILAWIAGDVAVGALYRREHIEARQQTRTYEFAFRREFLIATTAIGMIAPFAWAATTGIDLAQIRNVGALLDAASDAHQMLATQRVEQDIVNKICLMIALAGVIVGGIYMGVGRPGKRIGNWLLAAPVLPYLMMMLLTTIRSLMVIPILMMFGSWIAGLALRGRDRSIFEAGRLIKIGGVVCLMLVIVLYLQGVREGDYTFSRFDKTIVRMRLWAAGYEPALVAYVTRVWDHRMEWGGSSFRVVTSLFGADDTKIVYGTGALDIGMNETSNAMTALRFILDDWGIVGSVIFCAFWGGVTGLSSEACRAGKLWVSPLLGLLISVAIFSPNSWFLNYGTRVFAPFLVVAYLTACGKTIVGPAREQRRRRRRSSSTAAATQA
jgi:oligosaccharide repeat unit polymerase